MPICPSTTWKGAQTLFMYPEWVWNAFIGGFQPQQWHHNITRAQSYHIFSKFCPHLHRYRCVRVYPYDHSQHTMMVLKQFAYIKYGCGVQSVWVSSLNHDTTMSFGLLLTQISQNLAPFCKGITCNRAPMCPSTAHKWAQMLDLHPKWMWDAVSRD